MTVWRVIPGNSCGDQGRVTGPLFDVPCALGKNGMIAHPDGREGDGKTPMGTYPLRQVFYRPDRETPPICSLPVKPISTDLGWCDDPESSHYNKLVQLPFAQSHERLWREDHLYDLILVVGHNDDPVVPGLGSCIFVHVARKDFTPTLGCVALEVGALRRLLRQIEIDHTLKIG